ncbi:MAG: hypothetical protein V1738_06755 [Patescibacteria group bacterium]
MDKKPERKIFTLPVILGAVFIVALLSIEYGKSLRLMARGADNPPTVEFTWVPVGRVSLKEMIGTVKLKDDHALDFTTYNLKVVELGRDIGLPIEGMLGREYEQQVSFAMFDGYLELLKRGQMTLQIEVADDIGQKTTIERIVKLKMPDGWTEESIDSIQLITE